MRLNKKLKQYNELIEENSGLKEMLGMTEIEVEKLKANQINHEQLICELESMKKKAKNYEEVVEDNMTFNVILELTRNELDRLKGKK